MSWKSSIFYYSLQCCLQIVVHQINACDYQSRPTHCLAESPKLYTECPGFSNRLSSVECSYSAKVGLPPDRLPIEPSCPRSNAYPGKPYDLKWSIYTFNDSSKCVSVFNVTWQLPQDGSSNFVTGFALYMKYIGLRGPNPTRVRIFHVRYPDPDSYPPDLNKVQFYYDCFPVVDGVVQHITVYSLPRAPASARPTHSVMFVRRDQQNDDDSGPDGRCGGSWIPRVTVIPHEVEANISVSFDPAPHCYQFSAYNVSLVSHDSGHLHYVIDRKTLFHPRNNEKLHFHFTDVCPDVIAVMIQPFVNETCGCVTANYTSSSASCRPCTVTSIAPVNMTLSRCKQSKPVDTTPPCSPGTTTRSPTAVTQVLRPRPEPTTTENVVGHLAGVTVGVLVAIFLLVLIAVLTYHVRFTTRRRRCGRDSKEQLERCLHKPDDDESSGKFSIVPPTWTISIEAKINDENELMKKIKDFNEDYDKESVLSQAKTLSVHSCIMF